jgi:hypothetical protein
MTRLIFLALPIAWLLGGCLPNPQSEWTSSEGGSQRSTLVDPTILAQSTAPPGGGFFDFDWGSVFSFSASDDRDNVSRERTHAHPTVEHRFGTMTSGDHRASSRISGGGGGSGGRRR